MDLIGLVILLASSSPRISNPYLFTVTQIHRIQIKTIKKSKQIFNSQKAQNKTKQIKKHIHKKLSRAGVGGEGAEGFLVVHFYRLVAAKARVWFSSITRQTKP